MSAIPSNQPNPFAPLGGPNAGAPASGFDEVDSQDFMAIIFSELQNQDPLAPNDTQALLDQISTIRSIESDIELGEQLEEIARRSELTSAGSLVGTFIAGRTANGQEVVGFVDSVSVTRNGLALNLGTGFVVDLENVSEIVDPTLLEAPDNAEPTAENSVPDQNVVAGEEVSFTFSTNTFADADPDDVLSYSAALSDGSEPPEWITFDPETRTFTFAPGMEDVGSYTIRLTATDQLGASAATTFDLRVSEFPDEEPPEDNPGAGG
jgi:flagellar basal-body rod modification protein FlgD